MAEKPYSKDDKVDVIDRQGPYIQESFDLNRLQDFVTGLGVEYCHFKAMPSPIGKNDPGDYRRSDGVDTITSNGMIYISVGKFTATMTDNSRDAKRGAAGVLDPSESKLVMPRFYNKDGGIANGERIYLMPGDRIYVHDKKVDDLVEARHYMEYQDGASNVPMFPIVRIDLPIIDSRNQLYVCGVDFQIDGYGNIEWGSRNPGVDPVTGEGRVYSVRYRYRAFWYIVELPKEVRITGVTNQNGDRVSERGPYHAIAMREIMFHNQNRGAKTNQLKAKDPNRAVQEPHEPQNPSKYVVPVDISAIGSSDDETD